MDQQYGLGFRPEGPHKTSGEGAVNHICGSAITVLKHANAVDDDIDLVLREDFRQSVGVHRHDGAFNRSGTEGSFLRRRKTAGNRYDREALARKEKNDCLTDQARGTKDRDDREWLIHGLSYRRLDDHQP